MSQAINIGSSQMESGESSIGQIREGFWTVARCIGQHRVHERLQRASGVRIDRAGAALLYMLLAHGDSRVTGLADRLGVDAPSVTRKVQQLEKEGLVTRRADAEDRRASCIQLTASGRRTLESVLKARRAWFDRVLEGWEEADLLAFASMLSRFANSLEQDLEQDRGGAG
ncbi:MAG: MarR family transcriptional regulator [Acidimicrobiales bacterium]